MGLEDFVSLDNEALRLEHLVVELFAGIDLVQNMDVNQLMDQEMKFRKCIEKLERVVGTYSQLEPALNRMVEKYVDICKEIGMVFLADQSCFDPPIAFLYLEKALKFRPKCAHVLMDMAIVHSWLGCDVQAIETWFTALKLCDPDDPADAENIKNIRYNLMLLGVEI